MLKSLCMKITKSATTPIDDNFRLSSKLSSILKEETYIHSDAICNSKDFTLHMAISLYHT